MQRVRGRSLGARRGPDTRICSSLGVQDRRTRQSEPHGAGSMLLPRRAQAKLMWGPSTLRASPERPGPGGSPQRQAAQRGPAAGDRTAPTRSGGGGEGAPPGAGTLGVGSPAPAPAPWGPFPRGRGGRSD